MLITLSHSLRDTTALELAGWMQSVCTERGLNAFYQENLSGSVKLDGPRRRVLRNAFESARCVAAAAVASAHKHADTAPLANEILWAEQHRKQVVLVYDSSRPFDLHLWESTWPSLFQPQPLVARYYGKGHESCVEGFIAQVHSALSGAIERSAPSAPSKPKPINDDRRALANVAAIVEEISFSDEGWELALNQLRAVQPNDLPVTDVRSRGILKRSSERKSKRRSPDGADLIPEEATQEAIHYILNALPATARDERACLELLCASVGVSERLVAASLRLLSARIKIIAEVPDVKEVVLWSMIALRRHSDSVDVCTFAMECLDCTATLGDKLLVFSSADAESLVAAIRNFPSCHALQRHGFSFLRHLLVAQGQQHEDEADDGLQTDVHHDMLALPGGGLARVVTRLGAAELGLSCLSAYRGDEDLFQDICFLLEVLCPSSREVKLSVLKKGDLWVQHLRRSAGSGHVVLSMLSSLADDDENKVAVAALPGLLEALLWRLKLPEDVLEVFALLCCLTSQCLQNKRLCSSFCDAALLTEAVRCSSSSESATAIRLAAGGFLVNVCSDSRSVTTALSSRLNDAAISLSDSFDDELVRCGEALRQLTQKKDLASFPHASDGGRWKPNGSDLGDPQNPFAGLFAIRRQAGKEAEELPRVMKDDVAKEIHQNRTQLPEPKGPREYRGPGWQRLPSHLRGHCEETNDREVKDKKDENTLSNSFELGEWASSQAALPLKGFEGLSKELWIGSTGDKDYGEQFEVDQEEVSGPSRPSPRSLLQEELEASTPSLPAANPTQAPAKVSKGRTLRHELDKLRQASPAPKASRTLTERLFSFFRRSSSSEPEHQSGVTAARAARDHDLWMAEMAASTAIEEGEVEIDVRMPSQHSLVDKARSRPGLGSRGRSFESEGPLSKSSSKLPRFTSQDFNH